MQDATQAKTVGRTRRWAGILGLGGALAVLAALLVGLSIRASSRGGAAPAFHGPVDLHPIGEFTHPAGFRMPERVGPFQRVAVTQYDAAGNDISAGYNRILEGATPWPIFATVYVYPRRGGDLDRYFDKLLRDLGQMHGGATPQVRKDILLVERYVGRYAVFGYEERFEGSAELIPVRSYVVVYGWQGFWVKWRVTTPAPVTDERMREILDLTEALLPPDEAPDADPESESETDTGAVGPPRTAKVVDPIGSWIFLGEPTGGTALANIRTHGGRCHFAGRGCQLAQVAQNASTTPGRGRGAQGL